MANQVNVAGLAAIKLDTGASNALELLGYTEDGAQITFKGFFHDVPTDENGGPEGPPTDIQYFGETAEIRLLLPKFDPLIVDKMFARAHYVGAATPGVVQTPGSLMIAGAYSFRLLIHSTTAPMNFPISVFREPHELNKGTKYSKLLVVGTAYKNQTTGVLWNTVTS